MSKNFVGLVINEEQGIIYGGPELSEREIEKMRP